MVYLADAEPVSAMASHLRDLTAGRAGVELSADDESVFLSVRT